MKVYGTDKKFVDIVRVFGACLDEEGTDAVGVLFGVIRVDHLSKVAFVSCNCNQVLLAEVRPQLLDPILNRFKGVGTCHIVNHNADVGSAVVHWRQGFVPFLTCRVPDVQFQARSTEVQCFGHEGSSNGFIA